MTNTKVIGISVTKNYEMPRVFWDYLYKPGTPKIPLANFILEHFDFWELQ